MLYEIYIVNTESFDVIDNKAIQVLNHRFSHVYFFPHLLIFICDWMQAMT